MKYLAMDCYILVVGKQIVTNFQDIALLIYIKTIRVYLVSILDVFKRLKISIFLGSNILPQGKYLKRLIV